MDWKSDAIDKLKKYEAKRESLQIIPKQIAEIDSTMTSIRSARADKQPVKGGGNRQEDTYLDCIVRKDELTRCMERAKLWLEIVDGGLSVLVDEERLVLERFYIHPEKGAADRLATELSVDIKTVYHRKDKALRKFTIALHGAVES